ncbi:hypothetical protein H310_11705 [Aphanomyces invadans]|uniref:DDE-1 domain-containing protein n=1 Tax=Aphanomyces invadans TaxID=157072 RepID=A0A024TL28_9STRA|nr:hypothetical protein H310_11705 [Aphanomyces invadans]ETV94743.1 hypothetical protein H310_11705 [Aphanomyces invadans]|eukprot:XP_008876688.1 hypothetical protein H310_11705 [Aphanomyces invadans]
MIVKMQAASIRDIAADTGIPKSNFSRWKKQSNEILHFEGTMKRFHLHCAGRPVMIPNADGLETFMHKRRDAELALTCTHLVNYLKRNHKLWLEQYLSHHRSSEVQADTRTVGEDSQKFAQDFNVAFSGFDPSLIINVDETGMTYEGEKHSYPMTAVLSVRANGDKLPILFIMRGEPGGRIETGEFDTYLIGHYYAVQECAWMVARIWAFYLRHY